MIGLRWDNQSSIIPRDVLQHNGYIKHQSTAWRPRHSDVGRTYRMSAVKDTLQRKRPAWLGQGNNNVSVPGLPSRRNIQQRRQTAPASRTTALSQNSCCDFLRANQFGLYIVRCSGYYLSNLQPLFSTLDQSFDCLYANELPLENRPTTSFPGRQRPTFMLTSVNEHPRPHSTRIDGTIPIGFM